MKHGKYKLNVYPQGFHMGEIPLDFNDTLQEK